jgi:hypothetical protein
MKNGTVGWILVVVIALAVAAQGADCPRFRGPAGDGKFAETGLLKKWPEGRAEAGLDGPGAGTRVFLGRRGDRHCLCDRDG